MPTATLKIPKTARAQSRRVAAAYRPAPKQHLAKQSKRALAEVWAQICGVMNTGETDLSTCEGFGR